MRCKSIVKSDVFGAVCIVIIPDIQVGELLCIKYGQPKTQQNLHMLIYELTRPPDSFLAVIFVLEREIPWRVSKNKLKASQKNN